MAQVRTEFTADDRKLIDSLNKQVSKLEQVNQKLRQTGKQAKKTGKSFATAFGSGAGIGIATQAMSRLSSALAKVNADARASAENMRGMESALKGILQISNTVAENKSLDLFAQKLTAKFGIPEGKSLALVQQLTSLGIDRPGIETLARTSIFESDPALLAERVGDLRGVFKEGLAGVPVSAIINSLLEAQKPSKLGAAQVAALSLAPAGLAKELGGTFVESAGLTAFASVGAETPEQGATQAQAFLAALVKDKQKRFAGLGITGGIQKFLSLGQRDQDTVIGGRKEGIIFAGKLREDFIGLRSQIGAIQRAFDATGTDRSNIAVKESLELQNPRVRQINESAKVRARTALVRQGAGSQLEAVEAIQEDFLARLEAAGVPGLNRGAQDFFFGVENLAHVNPRGQLQRRAFDLETRLGPAAAADFVRSLTGMVEASEQMAERQTETNELLRTIANNSDRSATQIVVSQDGDIE